VQPAGGQAVVANVNAPITTATLTGLVPGTKYTISVTAANVVGTSPAATTTVLSASAPTLTGTASNATAGSDYRFRFSVGGAPTPIVTVVSGSLPTGMTLAPSGEISGTPTTAGTSAFTLSASNGYGAPATLSSTITVAPGPQRTSRSP
jgi:hypothetical protein